MVWGKQRSASSPSRLYCSSFLVSVLNFATSPNSGVKLLGGFLRSEKTIFRFISSGGASFSWFFIFLLLRSRDPAIARPWGADCNDEGLLQHVVGGGHTWAQNFDSWWDCLHKSATIAKKEGLLGAQEIDTLKMCYPKWQGITKGANWGKPCGCTFGLTTCLGMLSSVMPLAPLLP